MYHFELDFKIAHINLEKSKNAEKVPLTSTRKQIASDVFIIISSFLTVILISISSKKEQKKKKEKKVPYDFQLAQKCVTESD